jgi:hypothetical protein
MTSDRKLALIKRHAPTFVLTYFIHGGQRGWCATVKVGGKLLNLSEVGAPKFFNMIRDNIIQACFEDDRIVPRHARLSA